MLFRPTSTTTTHQFIAAILAALVIFLLTFQSTASAQGPTTLPVNANALGKSPFANYGETEVPLTVKGKLTILHGDDFANKKENHFII